METRKIDISSGVIWRIILIALLLWFLFFIRDILLLLILAIVVVSAALPLVDKMESKKIPRALGTLGIFLGFILVVAFIFYLILPQLVDEFKQLGQTLPKYFEGINRFFENASQLAITYNFSNLQDIIDRSSEALASSASSFFSSTVGFLGGFLKIIIIFSLSFYMLVKRNGTQNFIKQVTPAKHQEYVTDLINRIQRKMGRWLVGQIALIFIVFGLYYLALTLLGVPFALALAIFGGLLEIIPYLGPIIAAIPAILLAFTVSPLTALLVAAAYFLIQQMENHLFTPLIMRKAVGLNPVIVILALLVGAKIAGILGVILAVPVTTAIGVFIKDLMEKKEAAEADA